MVVAFPVGYFMFWGNRLASGFATIVCVLLWLFRDAIVGFYTSDPTVSALVYQLLPIIVVFHWFDALQCSATQSLRGYRQTLVPMLIYAVALWGIGLGLGYSLAFAPWPELWQTPRGALGFWGAQTLSLVVAAAALHWDFARISRPTAR